MAEALERVMEKELNCKTYSESVSCSVCLQVFESSRIYMGFVGFKVSCSLTIYFFVGIYRFAKYICNLSNLFILPVNVYTFIYFI